MKIYEAEFHEKGTQEKSNFCEVFLIYEEEFNERRTKKVQLL
jgi:hypothetical protein